MSYLHLPRLTFSGDFKSDVSTINNDPAHYNNDTFLPSFQKPGKGAVDGWWNPEGGATFEFQNCIVKQVVSLGNAATTDPVMDKIIGQVVRGADGRNTGKMVDLDPQEQGTSELWGVLLRILTADNDLLIEGKIATTAFRDLQTRQYSGASVNGQPFGGSWTSVLTNVTWGDAAKQSPFLMELKSVTQNNQLSVHLNAFGYYYNHAPDGRFSLGRISGTIGPSFANEPKTFTLARRLYGVYSARMPNVQFSNSNFLVDRERKSVTVDLGGSFPITDAFGNVGLTQELSLAVAKNRMDMGISDTMQPIQASDMLLIGKVSYETGYDWLYRTGGIVSFSGLSSDILELLQDHQLLLLVKTPTNTYVVAAREAIDGYLVRPDEFVNRLDPGQVNKVNFYAAQYGRPLQNRPITISLQPATPITPVSTKNPICEIPGNNYPADGISFSPTITTDDNGIAVLSITGNRIDSPRGYIDGQIYFLDYNIENVDQDSAIGPLNNENVFIHLRDYFDIPHKPDWTDIEATMVQFANLYPIMSKYFIDFRDPNAVIQKRELMQFAFSRDIDDPIYMPVTRDLSENKRLTILKWLANPVIEKEPGQMAKSVSPVSSVGPSPATEGYIPTVDQERLKLAVRMKNGANISFLETNNPFNF